MKNKKAQISETMGFLILVIGITLAIIIFKLFIVTGSTKSMVVISDRYETERLRAGVNALFMMTDKTSGKTLLDLIGMAAGLRSEVVYIGPTVGNIDVSQELWWRMDALFEKDHWYIFIPFPKKEAAIQIIIVADTSGSLCDDFEDMKNNLPKILDNARAVGKDVAMTIYLLGGSDCSRRGYPTDITCDVFPQTKYLICKPITYILSKADCKLTSQTAEDWGNGMACAADYGPEGGWTPGGVRIGMVLSDELPGGSECGQSDACRGCDVGTATAQAQSLQNGIESSLEHNVTVFSLMANACGKETGPGTPNEFICECSQSGVLRRYFDTIANATGGKTYELENATDVSESIKDIIESINVTVSEGIRIGTTPPKGVRVRVYEVLVPVSRTGEYTKAYIYQWSY